MGSSKTAQLLMQRYNYQQLGLKVALVKPAIDTRAGVNVVYSRIGLEAKAEIVLDADTPVREQLAWLAVQQAHNTFQYVFVDEAQFLTRSQVELLVRIVDDANIPVICYGLRTDFRNLSGHRLIGLNGCPNLLFAAPSDLRNDHGRMRNHI